MTLPLLQPDCIKATVDLIKAPSEKLTQRTYNVTGIRASSFLGKKLMVDCLTTGMSFSPAQLAESIRKFIPEFKVSQPLQSLNNSQPCDIASDTISAR